jgi:G:T/U-mismatch repair DNA glycosylase
MWRMMGLIFEGDKNHFICPDEKKFNKDRIITFLNNRGIALSDTAQSVIRRKENASDKFLEIILPIDLEEVLSRISDCRAIVVTGQKAMDTLLTIIEAKEPAVGYFAETIFRNHHLRIYRMPSSSRAYPKPLAEKATVYKNMFEELGLFL